MATRISLHDFILANPIYVGATVTAWLVDVNGNVTTNKATLYEAPTGTSQLANPQTLDSDGKFQQPVYCEQAVRLEVSGLHITTHTTGVISPGGTWRGDWAGATLYQAGDWVRDGAAGDNTLSVYQIVNTHTSGTWGVDVLDATKLALVIDYTSITAQVVPDATERTKGKARLSSALDLVSGRKGMILPPDLLLPLWALHEPANFSAAQADINAALAIDKFVRPDRLWTTPMRGGWKNIVGANGGFEVWQRGAGGSASIAVPAGTVAYTADRWWLGPAASTNMTASQQAGLEDGSRSCIRLQRDAGATGIFFRFGYPLDADEVQRLRGKKASVRFKLRAGANWSPVNGGISCLLFVGTSAVSKRNAVAYANETLALSVVTQTTPGGVAITVNSPQSAVLPTNITSAELQFAATLVGTAGANDWIEIDDVDLRVDEPVIDQFERRPFYDELFACQAHFWKTFNYDTAPVQNEGGVDSPVNWRTPAGASVASSSGSMPHPRMMRATPTAITYNPAAANAEVRNATDSTDCSATSVAVTPRTFNILFTTSAGTAANELMRCHLTMDAGI